MNLNGLLGRSTIVSCTVLEAPIAFGPYLMGFGNMCQNPWLHGLKMSFRQISHFFPIKTGRGSPPFQAELPQRSLHLSRGGHQFHIAAATTTVPSGGGANQPEIRVVQIEGLERVGF